MRAPFDFYWVLGTIVAKTNLSWSNDVDAGKQSISGVLRWESPI